MGAEILYFSLMIGYLFLGRRNSRFISIVKNPLYFSWMLMSMSIFGYQPTTVQYIFRASAMIISLITCAYMRKEFKIINRGPITILILYLLLCFGSVFWSVDKIQTLIKVMEIAVDMLLISTILQTEEKETALYKLFYVLLGMCILLQIYVALGAVVMHSKFLTFSRGVWGIKLTGVIVSADSLGGICVFVLAALMNMKDIKYRKIFMSIAIVELLLCQARTSLISFSLIALFVFFRTKNKFLYISAGLIVGLLTFKYRDYVYKYFLRGSDALNMKTMSGRTVMWNNAKSMIAQKPWFGYGFGSGGEIISLQNNGMTSLHSGIYETLIGVGYIGFSLLVIIYLFMLAILIRNIILHGLKNNVLEIMLFSDLTIRSYMSTGIGGWHSHVLMIWLLLVFSYSIKNINTYTTIVSDGSRQLKKKRVISIMDS